MKKLLASVAVLAVVALAAPVLAADAPGYGVTVGGRIKADMGWQILPEESNRNNSDSSIANFFATVNTNSYLRVLFTSADKTTGAHIELGFGTSINQDNNGSSTDNFANLRFGYGWWKVGSCKLLVGQFAGRLGDRYFPGSNLGHTKSYKTDLAGFGFIGGTRNPKIALQMDVNENFGFEVALGQAGAETSTSVTDGGDPATTLGSSNSYLPRLEVVFDFKFGNFMITPGAGISYMEWKYDESSFPGTSDFDDDVISYLLWLPMQYKSGPLTIMLNGFYGQNIDTDWTGEWGNINNWGSPNDFGEGARINYQFGGQPAALPYADANGKLEDTSVWGVGLAVQFAFTDQLGVNIGGGVVNLSNDAWEGANDGNDDYTRWAAFIAMPYQVTSNFTIAPEIAYYNYGDKVGVVATDDDDEAKDEWLLGVHFQFLF